MVVKISGFFEDRRKKELSTFCDEEGYMLSASSIESVFHPILEEIQDHRNMSLAYSITIRIDVKEHYRYNPYFRRRVENQELDNGLDNSVINFVHRWSDFEGSKGKQTGFNMLEHYAAGANTQYLQISILKIL